MQAARVLVAGCRASPRRSGRAASRCRCRPRPRCPRSAASSCSLPSRISFAVLMIRPCLSPGRSLGRALVRSFAAPRQILSLARATANAAHRSTVASAFLGQNLPHVTTMLRRIRPSRAPRLDAGCGAAFTGGARPRSLLRRFCRAGLRALSRLGRPGVRRLARLRLRGRRRRLPGASRPGERARSRRPRLLRDSRSTWSRRRWSRRRRRSPATSGPRSPGDSYLEVGCFIEQTWRSPTTTATTG